MALSAPSAALVRNSPTAVEAIHGLVQSFGNRVAAILGRRVETFDETEIYPTKGRTGAVADATTRVIGRLEWLREQEEETFERVQDALIAQAMDRNVDVTAYTDSSTDVVRLAQEVGASMEEILAAPTVAHPVRATVKETIRAYEEIFGAADRKFRGRREAGAVRVSRWEAMMDAAERDARPSFSPALEARPQDAALAA